MPHPDPIDLSKTDEPVFLAGCSLPHDALRAAVSLRPNERRASEIVGPDRVLRAADTVQIGIRPQGRVGELSIGIGRVDLPHYASASVALTGHEDPDDVATVALPVPRSVNEHCIGDVPVFVSHIMFFPRPTDEPMAAVEQRERRISAEVERWTRHHEGPDLTLAESAKLVRAIWYAVGDLDLVPQNLHPIDVLEKHIQRGNILKDGSW